MSKVRPLRPSDPRRIGDYQLLGRLGDGGQGVVFLGEAGAFHPGGFRRVAIKSLHSHLAQHDGARRRLRREAIAAAKVIDHTARVLDIDTSGARPYIVSEFVDGPSLKELVSAQGPRSGADLWGLTVATASALHAIHQAGVVHRDLKPHNVLMTLNGPRVIDFGFAQLLEGTVSMASGTIGTPAYIAPELLEDKPATPKSDVFSWAAMITFAATGQAPFGNDAVGLVINRVLNEEPYLDGLPGTLRELVSACLDKDPDMRPDAWQILRYLHGETKKSKGLRSSPLIRKRKRFFRGSRGWLIAAVTRVRVK